MGQKSEFHTGIVRRRQQLISELQTHGLRLLDDSTGVPSRRGGAGPSDHKAVTVLGTTVMVPVHTQSASGSVYSIRPLASGHEATLLHGENEIGRVLLPPEPKFYRLATGDGIPYWKIAQLHARDVLATTVLQTCVRYGDPDRRCQFCAIGESLGGGRTIAHKTPAQLAEVAEAAKRLDGVCHVVMTTGTPPTPDRGAAVLCESAAAVARHTALPIQGQCEPPDDFSWFRRLRDAGIDTLGMHLEALDPEVRARVMPSKAETPVEYYLEAYRAAVAVFGRGQVSTYLIAGLGDTREGLLDGCRILIELGVYPFVVPLVPISGTRLEGAPPPSVPFMHSVLEPLGSMLREAGLTSARIKSGCGKCGACSPLSSYEVV